MEWSSASCMICRAVVHGWIWMVLSPALSKSYVLSQSLTITKASLWSQGWRWMEMVQVVPKTEIIHTPSGTLSFSAFHTFFLHRFCLHLLSASATWHYSEAPVACCPLYPTSEGCTKTSCKWTSNTIYGCLWICCKGPFHPRFCKPGHFPVEDTSAAQELECNC